MCDQQRLRSACAYAQSDQSLCLSLEYSMTVKLLSAQHLEFLRFKGGCIGSYESTLVKMPHSWKSDVAVQLLYGPCHVDYNLLGLRPDPEVIKLFSRSTQLSTKCKLLIKLKYQQIKKLFALSLPNVLLILLINVKMPTIVSI